MPDNPTSNSGPEALDSVPVHVATAPSDPEIALDRVDPEALKVLRHLRRNGHQAYLVGGCVRDLLLAASRRTSTSPPRPAPSSCRISSATAG